jgi:hypothetical protein
MKRTSTVLALSLLVLVAPQVLASSPEPLVASLSRIVIPTSANLAGAQGAQFTTRLSILNVTDRAYNVGVIHYGNDGNTRTATISLGPRQIRNYENFLQELFSFSGAGAAAFASLDDQDQFMVIAEVVNDVGNGKFKTVVASGAVIEESYPELDNLSLGINVDTNNRTNLGIFNDSNETNNVFADAFNSSGVLVATVAFENVPPRGWQQKSLGSNVSGGFIKWRVSGPHIYAWAVVVDNRSNDGTFLPAADVVR